MIYFLRIRLLTILFILAVFQTLPAQATDPSQQQYSLRSENICYISYADGFEELYDLGVDENEWFIVAQDPIYKAIKENLVASLNDQIPQDKGLYDPFDDFSMITEMSDNLALDTINPGNFQGDSSRIVRTNLVTAYMIYAFDSIADFLIDFWVVDDQSGEITISVSADGTSFFEIELDSSLENHGYRDKIIYSSKNILEDVHFLKIEISGGDGAWKGQIGSVDLIKRSNIRSEAAVFYIDAEKGSDNNPGTSPEAALQSLEKINEIGFFPGDSILLTSGQEFFGTLFIQKGGTKEHPIYIGKYGGDVKPIINSAGFVSAIRIENAGNITVADLEIRSDGGEALEPGAATSRFGINVSSSISGEYANLKFRNLYIHHIFATESVESDGQNPTSNMGMGINILMMHKDARIKNVTIEDSKIAYTGHTGIKVFGSGSYPGVSYLDSVLILNNTLEHIGGPGMVPGRCSHVLVRGNTVNYPGSSADPRMHNRGSGIWPWTCKNVVIEKNRFQHAWGKYDSCGAHIDFNCSNVIIQQNLSYDNAGGFVEILGNDVNCIYRYNISINDGFRKEGVDGALSNGHIFWIASYTGQDAEPIGAKNCSIYNNTIYVGPGIQSNIELEYDTQDNIIENNIIYVNGSLEFYNAGTNNTFNNNIWFGNIPELPFGAGAIFADPGLLNPGDTLPESYMLKENSPAVSTGGVIASGHIMDFWGDSIFNRLPVDRGADETTFNPDMWAIESRTVNEGGWIYPSGTIELPEGADVSFWVRTRPGCVIKALKVDEHDVGTDSVYLFENLAANHSIEVEFFAPKDSVTDPLNDFSIVASYSGNMRLQDENPENFEGDTGRAVRRNTAPGHIVYRFKEISDFEVEFWGVNGDNGALKVYTSLNGIEFTEIEPVMISYSDFGYRNKAVFANDSILPEGINQIKFEIVESDAAWKSQIGSVFLSWYGDEREKDDTLNVVEDLQILSAYPNPADETLFLRGLNKSQRIEIYSIHGSLVSVQESEGKIDISHLIDGTYFIKPEDHKPIQIIKQSL